MASPVKRGAPACGLYLRLPHDAVPEKIIAELRQIFLVINRSPYEKNMHVLEIEIHDAPSAEARAAAELFTAFARQNGMTALVRGQPLLAKECGADGVIVSSASALGTARGIFGEDGIAGLACGLSSDAMDEALRLEADFISLGSANSPPPAALLQRWMARSEKPVLAEGVTSDAQCVYYAQAGATFLDALPYIMNEPRGVMQGTVNILDAIEEALAQQRAVLQ